MRIYFFDKMTHKALCYLMFIDVFKITFYPNANLITWGGLAILLDLVSGVLKSLSKHQFVISTGIRKTIIKLAQYFGVIICLWIFTNVLVVDPEFSKRALKLFTDNPNAYQRIEITLTYFNNLILLIIIYTELLSTSENFIQIQPNSQFSRSVLVRIHALLSFSLFSKTFFTIIKPHRESK